MEEIIEAIDNSETPLEQALQLCEEGNTLGKSLSAQLSEMEEQLTILTQE
jgi:exodeoxyribonuclease VII small subunit